MGAREYGVRARGYGVRAIGYCVGAREYSVGARGYGNPCDFSVIPVPTNWTWILIWDCIGLRIGIGSRGTGLGTMA